MLMLEASVRGGVMEIIRSRNEINTELQECKTNHLLHFIMTLITFGGWSMFWMVSAAVTEYDKNKIRFQSGIPKKRNIPALALVIWIMLTITIIVTAVRLMADG